jgi:ESCRT-II complex subunit VPS25
VNDAVRAKQLQQWRNLIVSWHQARKLTTMRVAEWPLWENKAIDRRMSSKGVEAVLEYLVKEGNCEWADSAHTTATVFYKTPAEWASLVLAYVHANGMYGTMYTVYELSQGDTTADAGMLVRTCQ